MKTCIIEMPIRRAALAAEAKALYSAEAPGR